ncbi:MAG: hypothetical protein P4L93_04635 [Coriobacteriia bacterium]|nr:hypothetical protein [Coriobacteriia bacterium]
MSKKSMIIAGVVALVVVVIAAVWLLMPRGSSRAPLAPSTSTASSSGASTMPTAGSSTTPGTTSTTSTSIGTTTGQATTQPTSGKSPSDAATNGRGVSTDALTVYPKLPASGLQAVAPGAPIAAGQPLPPLKAAPANTISAVKTGVVQQGAQYKIVMRPLGIGPDAIYGSRLAVHVDSAQRVGIAPKKSPITNANVLVLVDTTHGGTVTKGGTYKATITFLSDGTKLIPVMTLASAK